MTSASTGQEFCDWLNEYNGSAYTATQGIVDMLLKNQFVKDGFDKPQGYCLRGGSSVVSWRRGANFNKSADKPGTIVILASHTDSPCLRTRPHDKLSAEKCELLGVSTYGGGLWHTWFDRPLGVSGCVTGRQKSDQKIISMPFRIPYPIAIVPNLCIHLQDREAAQAFRPQPEDTLRPVLSTSCTSSPVKGDKSETLAAESLFSSEKLALKEFIERELNNELSEILSYDLCLYDTAPTSIFGLKADMISAPGLDNKSSLWTTHKALIALNASEIENRLIVCIGFDHEEIGSVSTVGAGGNLLKSVLNELIPGGKIPWSNAVILSCDAAHGVHPNYSSKHQNEHKPCLNQGTVVKINVNQRYATSCESIGVLRDMARSVKDLKLQEFVVRNDSPCGSTIGPMTAAKTGCTTIDVGMPIWAMHSCRELCGVEDLDQMILLAKTVATDYQAPQFKMSADDGSSKRKKKNKKKSTAAAAKPADLDAQTHQQGPKQ